MLNNKLSIASLIMISAWGSLYAAEPAGRVLILQGSAIAVRGSQEVPLARGTTIESGDLLKVADSSSLQVRFTDESVVALRANSQYKIDDYKFSEKGDADKSVFSLLKGGMRTITGLIGKRNPENYQMRSTTATIGIRGTHFTAVNCASDCTNADGSKAEDGLYGGVTDGRIVVRNNAGETEFSRDQYFQVTSNSTLPIPLLAPPSFLRDKLDGLAKAGKGSTGKTAEVQMSGSSSIMETRSPAPTTFAIAPSTRSAQTIYQPMNNPVVAQAAAATASDLKVSTPVLLASLLPNTPLVTVPIIPVDPAITQPVAVAPVAPAAPAAPVVTQPPVTPTTLTSGSWTFAYVEANINSNSLFNSISDFTEGSSNRTDTLANVPTPIGYTYSPVNWNNTAYGPAIVIETVNGVTTTGTYNKSASTNTGSWTGAEGTANWGRFEATSAYQNGTVAYTEKEFTHWLAGPAVTATPTSGIFTFSHVGGTQPTDNFGNVGTLTSGGSWTVNFGSKTIASASPVTWTMPNGTSYTVSIASASLTSFGPDNFSGTIDGGTYSVTDTGFNSIARTGTLGGSCSGNGCTMNRVVLSPQFGGATATGLGVGITTNATTTSGSHHTAQVRAYTR